MKTVADAIQQSNVAGQYGAIFARALSFVLPEENEYLRGHWGDMDYIRTENVSGDNGRVTRYGVDQASHPSVDVASLTFDQAVTIYHQEWQAHGLTSLPDKLAIAAFDVWVNGGQANLWLQRAINHCYPMSIHLDEDGILGPETLNCLAACDQNKIVAYFIQERNARFQSLADNHPNDRQFLAGWEQRDTDLGKFLTT